MASVFRWISQCNLRCLLYMTQNIRTNISQPLIFWKSLACIEGLQQQGKKESANGDGLSHWFWREFAEELAPIVTSIFNLSIKSQLCLFLEICQYLPHPKDSSLSSLNQLRHISVTDNIIIRLLEKIIYVAEVKPVIRSDLSLDQFAYRKGTNTSQALIKSQHMWLK